MGVKFTCINTAESKPVDECTRTTGFINYYTNPEIGFVIFDIWGSGITYHNDDGSYRVDSVKVYADGDIEFNLTSL